MQISHKKQAYMVIFGNQIMELADLCQGFQLFW